MTDYFKVGTVKFEGDYSRSTLTEDDLKEYTGVSPARELGYFFIIDYKRNDDGFIDFILVYDTDRTFRLSNIANDFKDFRKLLINNSIVFNFETVFINKVLDTMKYIVNNDGIFAAPGELLFPSDLEKVN